MRWVLDKSAHVRLVAGASLPDDLDSADLVMCEMGVIEWLYSARSPDDYDAQERSLRSAYPVLVPPDRILERVQRLQADLAHHHAMWHRTAIPDLVIAETALHHDAGILHVDRDYARIATVRPALEHRNLTGAG